MASMVMGSPASSSSAQLLLLFLVAYFLFCSSLDAPPHSIAAAAEDPRPPVSFSFDFSDRSSYRSEDLKFEGNATVNVNKVDLTCNSYDQTINGCMGRMSYGHPVPFYDTTTGEVASFSTRFTFAINSKTTSNMGDGMAFFLAYYPSSMPPDAGGGYLGLIRFDERTAYDAARFVAVEFDTYANPWDPNGDHIGIDISTVQDPVNTRILTYFNLSGTMTASITFDNSTRMLVASLEFADNPSIGTVNVSRKLPDPFTLLPPEVAVGFSASTGAKIELHQILSWSFNSTLPAPLHKGHDKKAAIIGGSIVGALVLVLVVWCILSCWKGTSRRRTFEKGTGGPRQFEYHDLAAATGDFSEEKKLGAGAFGVVYQGFLKELDRKVAVKKILRESGGGNMDFFAELKAISEAKHKNLVKLVGWCRGNSWNISDFMCWCRQNNNNKLFLVYELVPNGNLHDHLHYREEVLSWTKRYKIVKGICSALLYLHEECHPYILHRDIKPSNILLDEHFNAKLADFGLSRIANHDNATLLTFAVGSEGYLDPQCRKSGMVEFNRSTDVYSFGLVLLEIACTRKSREHVCDLYSSKATNRAADQKLNGQFDVSEMDRVIVLGLRCSLLESTRRPTIRQAMDFLEHGVPLPELSEMGISVSSEHEVYTVSK